MKEDAFKDTRAATERRRIKSLSGRLFVSRAFCPFSTVGYREQGGRVGREKCPWWELGVAEEREGGFKQHGSHLQLSRTYISHYVQTRLLQEGPVCKRRPIELKERHIDEKKKKIRPAAS